MIGMISIAFVSSVSAQTNKLEKNYLKYGTEFKKEIEKKEKHQFTVFLKKGEALIASVDQNSIDVVIDVFDSKHQLIKSIDGSRKKEIIDVISSESGDYNIEIYPYDFKAKKGNYSFKVTSILTVQENIYRIAKKEIPSNVLYKLWKNSLTNKNAINQFLQKHKKRHIIEPISGNKNESRVTYFYVPSKNTEYMMQSGGPDFMGLRFNQLAKTKLYYASHVVPNNALFNYGFNEFKIYHLGKNKEFAYREIKHVYDSSVSMPYAVKSKYVIENNKVEKGTVKEFVIKSLNLNEERKVTVYIPANYDAKKAHNLMILFDGEEYGANLEIKPEVPTITILDNLHTEKKINPTITILVWHMGKRNKDLVSDTFGDFIAKELVVWARKKYRIGTASNYICVGGSSRGGFSASLIAINHSNIIGNVISQSGSYWITDNDKQNHWMYPSKQGKLILAYKKSRKLPIQFYMDVGLYDAGASMLGMNREFRSILKLKGYQLDYNEFNGGHSYLNWKQTLSNGIISIFGIEK